MGESGYVGESVSRFVAGIEKPGEVFGRQATNREGVLHNYVRFCQLSIIWTD